MTMKSQMSRQQLITIIGLILFGTIGRYVLFGMGVQPFPNFEVIMVVTFLAVMLIRSPLALIVPLVSMIGSDLLIGNPIFVGDQMNRIVLFTYSGFAIIGLLNVLGKEKLWNYLGQGHLKSIGLMASLGIGTVLLYDIWTNMGWWYLMYPHDVSSLILVYTAGLPFMLYHLISGIITFSLIGYPVILYTKKKQHQHKPHLLPMEIIHKIPAVLLVLALVALSFTGTALTVPQKSEIWVEKTDSTSVRIIINGDRWSFTDNLVAYQGDTAFSLLQRSAQQNGFSVESTYYASFDATLIDSINNAVGGTDGKYWQFYVNGMLPEVGADKCPLTNGDVVIWSYEVPPS